MRLKIKKSRKYRVLIYYSLVFITSGIIGAYFHNNILIYPGFFLILLSIFFEINGNKKIIQEIVLPASSSDESTLRFVINYNETDFWLVKKHIIINGWIYLYVVQQGSNKKLKVWLHKSNFVDENHIRDLARSVLFYTK